MPPDAPEWAIGYSPRGEDGHPEYECIHGVGHGGVHTCDGCCSTPEEHARAMREYNARVEPLLPVETTGLRVRTYDLMDECVEEGIQSAWMHAHKHVEHPTKETIAEHLQRDIMNRICERFDFPETHG